MDFICDIFKYSVNCKSYDSGSNRKLIYINILLILGICVSWQIHWGNAFGGQECLLVRVINHTILSRRDGKMIDFK